jgi:hypothetical protein
MVEAGWAGGLFTGEGRDEKWARNGLHAGKAKWAIGEKEGEWAGRRVLAQKV